MFKKCPNPKTWPLLGSAGQKLALCRVGIPSSGDGKGCQLHYSWTKLSQSKVTAVQDRKWQSRSRRKNKRRSLICRMRECPHAFSLLLFRCWPCLGAWHADSHLCGSDEYGSEYHYESVPGGYCVFSSQLRGGHAVPSEPDTRNHGSKAKDARRPVQELSHYKHDSITAMDRPFVPYFPRDEPPPERRRLDTNSTSGWFKCR